MWKRIKDCSGTSLVEAALITPLLLMLTLSMIDFGALFYAWLVLENGVSQATRYGVTGNQSPGLSREDSIKVAMKNATPTLTIPDGAITFSYLPAGGNTWLAGAGGPNDVQKLTVHYSWTMLTPFVRALFPGGAVMLTVESAMKNEPRFE